ncbi:MAG: hypothetical protein IJS08_07330 [Victivallales bacterium]|nr:hypothetical protein [Victivallales bacterium]
MDLFTRFSEPDVDFRAAPFWAWNAKLEPKELRRQIRIMKEMGLGGFFMHSRVGLDTEYLGKDWFKCIRACIDEAKKNGMLAWLYDEDRWPSGAAGGIVTKDDRYKEKKLCFEILKPKEKSKSEGNLLAWYTATFDGDKLVKATRVADEPKGKCRIRFFWRCATKSSWFNGQTYLDTMSKEGVQKFVDVTHEAYLREIGDDFGKTVPGIFTDEPCYSHFSHSDMLFPWSENFEAIFKKKFGYDLLDHLPEIFFDYGGEISKARWNYYDLLTTLFVEAFSKIIGKWCGKHNLRYTGHVLSEDKLYDQTMVVGSAMRFYEYMQQPGIDLLTEHWNILNTMKQCTSAAHQFGHNRRLCETYGCTGWDYSFAAHKTQGDALYATGINLRCQHLAWYSMSGQAKRDYPASISYQSPWAKDYKCVEDYFARLGAVMTEGEEVRELLVIHPVESTWSTVVLEKGKPIKRVTDFDEVFNKLTNKLYAENIDFDFGDEELLSRHGSVKGKKLQLAKAKYSAVLIPEVKTLRSTTIALLERYIAAGGTVFCMGKAPKYVDAVKSDAAAKLYSQIKKLALAKLGIELEALCRRVSIVDNTKKVQVEPVIYRMTEGKNFCQLFTCNLGMNMPDNIFKAPLVRERKLVFPDVTIKIKTAIKGDVYELLPLTGEIKVVDYQRKGNEYTFATSYEELGSRLFVISAAKPKGFAKAKTTAKPVQKIAVPAGPWKIQFSENNVLLLDKARRAIGGDKMSKDEQYILLIDDEARDKLGVQKRGGAMIQPYLRHDGSAKKSIKVKLEYRFDVKELPSGTCYLALENPELFTVKLNGVKLEKENGWWVDLCIRKLAIPEGALKCGANKITMECDYNEEMPGLEAMYLLGDFGVDAKDAICKRPTTLAAGDWCKQGLPYYAGNLTYKIPLGAIKKGKGRSVLCIGEWRGVALKVRINGGEYKMLPWPPYELDITDDLKFDGKDTAEITVIGHRRNAFGPFYYTEPTPPWTGAECLKAYLHPDRYLVPVGLINP